MQWFVNIKDYYKKYFIHNPYKKSILILVGGRILAQSLPILTMPLLTRLYSPSDFGAFSVYVTIVAIFSMISNGRYCLAILLPDKGIDAQRLVVISSVLSLLTSLVFTIIIILKGDYIFSLLNVPVLNGYKIFIGLSVLFIALYEALYYYALRNKRYRLIAKNIAIQSFIMVGIRIFCGYRGFSELGLIISYLIGYIIAYLIFLFFVRIDLRTIVKGIKWGNLLSKYIKFPRFSLFADLLNSLAEMFPNIGINMIFGNENGGYLAMSDKVLGSPVWLVISSVGDVFKQEASEQYRTKGSCTNIFKETSRDLFLLGIIPFLLIFILAPLAIPFFLGIEWLVVGDFIRIFCIMFFAKFIVIPVSHVVYIVGRQHLNILFQGMRFSIVIFSLMIGYFKEDIGLSLIVWSLLTTLCYSIIYIISLESTKRNNVNHKD